jgi:hypothetical protein
VGFAGACLNLMIYKKSKLVLYQPAERLTLRVFPNHR